MLKKIIRIIVVILYAILIVSAFFYARKMTINDLLTYTPENHFLAALFLFGLYALKSISVFFPIVLLQIASGFLFSPIVALFVNISGALIAFSLPYFLGRFTGSEKAEKKIKQNKTLTELFKKQHEHEFFISFFLRVVSCLPGDLVSMYLGTLKFDFFKYLTASLLGTLPGLIPATFMGTSITDPLSGEFISAFLITVFCSAASMIIYYFYNKKKKI